MIILIAIVKWVLVSVVENLRVCVQERSLAVQLSVGIAPYAFLSLCCC